jgi:hypothetical protein
MQTENQGVLVISQYPAMGCVDGESNSERMLVNISLSLTLFSLSTEADIIEKRK